MAIQLREKPMTCIFPVDNPYVNHLNSFSEASPKSEFLGINTLFHSTNNPIYRNIHSTVNSALCPEEGQGLDSSRGQITDYSGRDYSLRITANNINRT